MTKGVHRDYFAVFFEADRADLRGEGSSMVREEDCVTAAVVLGLHPNKRADTGVLVSGSSDSSISTTIDVLFRFTFDSLTSRGVSARLRGSELFRGDSFDEEDSLLVEAAAASLTFEDF